ncbi:MAG: helix-turn-helix domain-containing protein [Pseudonocardiaceae bacterium]
MFGIVLRHFRTLADLSLRELGKRCHYDYSRLSRMENGKRRGPGRHHRPDTARWRTAESSALCGATTIDPHRPSRGGASGGDARRRCHDRR